MKIQSDSFMKFPSVWWFLDAMIHLQNKNKAIFTLTIYLLPPEQVSIFFISLFCYLFENVFLQAFIVFVFVRCGHEKIVILSLFKLFLHHIMYSVFKSYMSHFK